MANRRGSPVWARIAAAPTADSPEIEVSRRVRPSSSSTRVIGVEQREISPLDALRQRAGAGGHITFRVGRDLQGVAVPSSAVAPPNAAPGQHGLLRTNTVTGATQIDPNLDFVGSHALPEGTQATWSGTLTAPTTGECSSAKPRYGHLSPTA